MDRARTPRLAAERTVTLPAPVESVLRWPLARWAERPVRALTGLDFVDEVATRALNFGDPSAGPGERFARALGVTLAVDAHAAARIPANGPLVVLSNHPFGFLDAASVCWLLDRARPDVRFLANRMMSGSTLARDRCFFVDAFGSDRSANAPAIRQALAWVRGGGCLAIFPSGEVMSVPASGGPAREAAWHPVVARLVRATGAPVLPLWVHGSNSKWFHAAGRLHPMLRTAMLPRELRRGRGSRVRISIGATIPRRTWLPHAERGSLLEFLRARTELTAAGPLVTAAPDQAPASRTQEPIAPPGDAWRAELAHGRLPELARLGPARVVAARGIEIPATMQEIGRLREATFRPVGEGSGRARDLDRFDDAYWQLVLVDDAADAIIGGYRLGLTDEVARSRGPEGLYTHSLFDYSERLLRELGPAIELGRSFVVQERQREAMPLHLLWKAIGSFIVERPRVKRLFGPVSISNDFSTVSRALLTEFLRANRLDGTLAALVSPRTPPPPSHAELRPDVLTAVAGSVDEVNDLVEQLEDGARGIPPLLRHYLRLNAKVLAFNVDPGFGNCLDALIMVDVPGIPHRILQRYMGDGLAGYLQRYRDTGDRNGAPWSSDLAASPDAP
jgi:putative hemolysin